MQTVAGRPDARSRRPVDNYPVIGQVVGIHIDETYLKDGLFDLTAAKPIARCGYHDYTVVESLFQMRAGMTVHSSQIPPMTVRNF